VSSQPFRKLEGGLIDRDRPLTFRFDGRAYTGFAGDTLASALLANGVRVVGRSFKYHRRRGIFAAGVEEPNALVALREDNREEPNLRATGIELFDGLTAASQNHWPSLDFDVGAINNVLSRFLPAGFYYKTFMWPGNAWMFYERIIRAAAGLGKAPLLADPDFYERRHAHCDVLIVGAGPSGLSAALAAGRSGARVVLVDDNPAPGGSLRGRSATIDDVPALAWVDQVAGELDAMANVRVLTRATAFGYYDQNLLAVCERIADHVAVPRSHQPRQRLWWIRARRVVLATGAIERPMVFAGNDLPGVMLASAVRTYQLQYAVKCGRRAVVFTNNDSAYECVSALMGGGVPVAAVVDARSGGPGHAARAIAESAGVELLCGYAVVGTLGKKQLSGVEVMALADGASRISGPLRRIECDLLCVSGGWNPTVHLFSQSQGKLRYDEQIASFVPDESRQAESSAGAARGRFALADCLHEGLEAGIDAARKSGSTPPQGLTSAHCEDSRETPLEPVWVVPLPDGRRAKRFVDLQNDVTAEDVALADREGYHSVEHLKRYTTLGMGTDQGRTSNVNGLAILARLQGTDIPNVGTTTFRPPFAPVTLGALAAREVGADLAPLRLSPLHDWHEAVGANFVTVGLWLRVQYYARRGEAMMDAINREVLAVRNGVGMVDVSTLGKIEIQGRDAAEFLDRVYINRWTNLAVGRCRYGFMLREDGFILDDGTTTRTGEQSFYMTTTTAQAGPVMAHLEYYAQTVWPELHVHFTSVTDQWAGMAIAGPRARDVLARACEGSDVGNEALPFMGYLESHIAGAPVRLFRMTFSGELAYEVHTPSDYATQVWEALMAAGHAFEITPYGTEAMSVLRIEKGHVVGAELDGRTTPADFGFERMQKKDRDFIGKRSLERPALAYGPRKHIVGLTSEDGKKIPRGAQIVWNPTAPKPVEMLGHVSSTCFSPNLGTYIALALLDDAEAYYGKLLYASSPLTDSHVCVRVGPSVFIDPQGERARG
jgi:sarcosine oxidase, subunit alpha